MTSGINQDVEILGKVFHLQTQLSRTAEPCIRTEVFHGGKLVATRDSVLESAELALSDRETLQRRLKEHHKRILESIVERARLFRERETGPRDVRMQAPGATELEEISALEIVDSTPVVVRKVDIALRVRRILERFRLRIGPLPAVSPSNRDELLARISASFAWILESPDFDEIRVDEQVRFNLLRDQIDDWLGGHRDPKQGDRVFAEVVNFLDYLAGVNNRAELAAFDRDLLRWALRKAEAEGLTPRLREHLEMISGRDPELDRLVEQESITSDQCIGVLRRVLSEVESSIRKT